MKSDFPGDVFIAVGGAALLAWYGWKRYRASVETREVTLACRAAGRRALENELHATVPVEETQPWEGAGGSVVCEACEMVYPAGTPYCLSCGEETEEPVTRSWRPAAGAGDDGSEPVCVHVVDSHWKASLLKGFLESHNIACITQGSVPSGVYHFSITPLSEVRLLVRREDVTSARMWLAEWT